MMYGRMRFDDVCLIFETTRGTKCDLDCVQVKHLLVNAAHIYEV